MTADRQMDFPGSMSKDAATELANARLAGEGDLLFFCKYARQKIDRFIEASATVAALRAGTTTPSALASAEAAERHARKYLDGAADLLNEQLTGKH